MWFRMLYENLVECSECIALSLILMNRRCATHIVVCGPFRIYVSDAMVVVQLTFSRKRTILGNQAKGNASIIQTKHIVLIKGKASPHHRPYCITKKNKFAQFLCSNCRASNINVCIWLSRRGSYCINMNALRSRHTHSCECSMCWISTIT